MHAQLSEECRDLLGRIFNTNEKQRITVPQIKEHPWFTAPLVGEYAVAAERIDDMQRRHDEYTTNRKISGVRPNL